MQETPLFTFRYHLTVDLLFGHSKLLPSYKKQLKIWRIISVFTMILFIANFITLYGNDGWWIPQYILLLLFVMSFLFPLLVKRLVKKQFLMDPVNQEEHEMRIYEDHLEVSNSVSNSSFQYEGINHVVETPQGVYLFMTEVKAIPIPREAISEQALEFLKSKIGR